jgi:hypothetical protein
MPESKALNDLTGAIDTADVLVRHAEDQGSIPGAHSFPIGNSHFPLQANNGV